MFTYMKTRGTEHVSSENFNNIYRESIVSSVLEKSQIAAKCDFLSKRNKKRRNESLGFTLLSHC